MGRISPRLALLAACLAAVGALVFGATSLPAGVVGSPHDFSATGPHPPSVVLAPSGACSGCHIPHGALDNGIWKRSLSAYRTAFDSASSPRNGTGSAANFILPPAMQCYDCHDFHGGGALEGTSVPALTDFASGYRPQDVLFGYSATGAAYPKTVTEYNSGPQAGKSPLSGFYETNPVGSTGSPNYGVNLSASPDQTGGHYFQNDPSTNATFDNGDKLPCRDCHDPHTWTNSPYWGAFIRKTWPTGTISTRLGTTAQASSFMSNQSTPAGQRSNAASRNLCIACHGIAGPAALAPVNFSDIQPSTGATSYRSALIMGGAAPPATVAEHASTSTVACVSCHKHNSVFVGCNSCHSYPGTDNSGSGIKQMSRGHWDHVGKPGTGGTDNSMKYACEVCHFNYSSRHNGSNNFTGNWWDNVDIQFDPALNPAFGLSGPTYRTQPAYGGAFAKGIGVADGNTTPTPTCAGLFCHGDHPDKNLMWEGAVKQPAWTGTAACGDCHRAGSTFRQGNHAVHVDNTGINARGPGGITAFSPAGNCSDGTPTGCHTAYALNPTTTHARGTTTFRTSPASGVATDNVGTQVCNACHSTYTAPYLDNTLILNTKTGVQLSKENWRDNTYRLPCLTCHNNSGQTPNSTANTLMNGVGTWAPGIEKYWRASGHGYSLVVCPTTTGNIDNCSTTTVSDNVNQVLPIACRYCHAIDSRHFGNTPANGNAWRLVSWSNYGDSTGGLDKFCALQCHGGIDAGTAWACAKPGLPMDHFWIDGNGSVCPRSTEKEPTDTHPTLRDVVVTGKTKDPHEMGANYMPLDNDIRAGGGANFLCVTCHDPHGTGPDAAVQWGRSFAGANPASPVDNVHMTRYNMRKALCNVCHLP